MRRLLLPLLTLALGAAPAVAQEGDAPPRIYRWVDENGVAHYTTDEDRIPASLRRRFGVPTQPLAPDHRAVGAPETVAPESWAVQERGERPPPRPAPEAEPGDAPVRPEASADVSTGLASTGAGSEPERLSRVELRIAELSAAISADEDMLSAWLADPDDTDVVALAETPQFREIAARLPKRIQELEALIRERDALVATP